LRNIGRTIEARLMAAGITNCRQLKKLGAVKAFLKMQALEPRAKLPVCYYLYSLQGALLNVHWDDVPERTKRRLVKATEAEEE